ncbi:MAG: chloride channel protein [Nitriliruptor sp.]
MLGAAYLALLGLVGRLLGPAHHDRLGTVVVLVGVGGAVAAIDRWVGSAGSVDMLVDNIHIDGGPRGMRELRNLIPTSLLCIGAGGGMGPEAPLVQSSGSIAAATARLRGGGEGRVRTLTIAGMAAAFAVLFGAPLGAALFALELPHRRGLEHHEAIIPAVVGSLTGLATATVLGGHAMGPVWSALPPVAETGVRSFGWAAIGVAVGVATATVFVWLVAALRRVATAVPAWTRPILGGLVLGGLGWWSPYALTFGEFQLDPLLTSGVGAGGFALAGIAKLAGTSVTLAAGWRGGFIIPLLVMGAAFGAVVPELLPGAPVTIVVVAAMVAANVGVTNTALGTAVVVTEMAGLHLLPTTLFAGIVSLAVTPRLGLFGSQRGRASHRSAPGAARPERR